jgi:CheY-like chemotaxis protein
MSLGSTVSQPVMRAHVLLVEDEEIIRLLLAEELRSHGLEVIQAASADEAWDVLESGTEVDLVFSDVAMPGSMSGMELLRRVRGAFPHIKRVLTSGNPGPENMAELGLFLQKPFRLETAAIITLSALGFAII